MTDPRCRYPNGDVLALVVAERLVTVTIDSEDAISILGVLREICCPSTLRIVTEAIVDA